MCACRGRGVVGVEEEVKTICKCMGSKMALYIWGNTLMEIKSNGEIVAD